MADSKPAEFVPVGRLPSTHVHLSGDEPDVLASRFLLAPVALPAGGIYTVRDAGGVMTVGEATGGIALFRTVPDPRLLQVRPRAGMTVVEFRGESAPDAVCLLEDPCPVDPDAVTLAFVETFLTGDEALREIGRAYRTLVSAKGPAPRAAAPVVRSTPTAAGESRLPSEYRDPS